MLLSSCRVELKFNLMNSPPNREGGVQHNSCYIHGSCGPR